MKQSVRNAARVLLAIAVVALVVAGCTSSGGGSADDWNDSRKQFDPAANRQGHAVLDRLAAAGIRCESQQDEAFSVLVESYKKQELPLPQGSVSCVGPKDENLLVEVFPQHYPTASDFIARKRALICEKALKLGKQPSGKNQFEGLPYVIDQTGTWTWLLEPDSFPVNRQIAKVLRVRSINACAGIKV